MDISDCFFSANNMVDGWATPPERFLTTVSALGLTFIFVISILFVIIGILIMILEFFKKDKK